MKKLLIGGLVVVFAAAAATGAVIGIRIINKREAGLPTSDVASYLKAWQSFDTATMAKHVDRPPADFAATVVAMKTDLSVTAARFQAKPEIRHGKFNVDAPYTASLDLAGLGTWDYSGTLHLVRVKHQWLVAWTPAAVEPMLAAGQHFARTRTWPERAPILGDDGTPLAAQTQVVEVGLEPDRIKDRNQINTVLGQQLGVTPAQISAALSAPGVQPSYFVPIAPVTMDKFTAMRPILEPIPGVFFQKTTVRLTPTGSFALQTIGRVGEVTAERLAQLKAPYLVGDTVGLSGLEASYERQLAGTPSGDVQIVDGTGKVVQTLFHFAGTAPQPLHLTLNAGIQGAAEQAMAGVTQPAALVAIDAPTGDVKAIVSMPLNQSFDRAIDGQYPPGSTFKVVSTDALLASGLTASSPATCPPTTNVGGENFKNFEGEALGTINLRTAFAQSCNTAFIGLTANLPSSALSTAATALGFGAKYPDFGLPVAGGTFPAPKDNAEKAAETIGQGRVVASPLQMASVAAAVDSGAWHAPRLLADTAAGPPLPALDPTADATLKDLMGEVVRTGTGTAAAIPGQTIEGKTGTAEVGTSDQTHAWFIGFRGNLAFAVIVEDGGVGGVVAAPLAAAFLKSVPQ